MTSFLDMLAQGVIILCAIVVVSIFALFAIVGVAYISYESYKEMGPIALLFPAFVLSMLWIVARGNKL